MADGSISQSELDAILNGSGVLEEVLEPPPEGEVKHIWIVKDITTGGVVGGRCWSIIQSQDMLRRAQECYPEDKIEIRQLQ